MIRSDASTRHGRNPREGRQLAALAGCLAVAVLFADLLFYPETQEDAFITFRYSRHLAEGYGPGAWNRTGDAVEGYTSALWMGWLAAAPVLGIQLETFAKVSGIAAHVALCVLLVAFPWLRDRALTEGDALLGADRDAFAAAAVAMGLYLPMCWYASSGMEVTGFALLVALALHAPVCTSNRVSIAAVYIALVWMRPEGALVGGVLAVLHLAIRWRRSAPLAPAWAAVAAVPAALAAITAFRLLAFGEWLPNTFYAKTAGAGAMHLRLGALYALHWAASSWMWLALSGLAFARALVAMARRTPGERLSLLVAVGLFAVYWLYALRIGGDNPSAFPYWRHLLHAAPLLFGSVGAGVVAVSRRRAIRWAVLAAALVAANWQVLGAHHGRMRDALVTAAARYPSLRHTPPNPYYLWLADLADDDTVVASAAAGELPFVVDAVHVDMLGLNDRDVARLGRFDPDGPVDSKSDIDSVMRRRPDVIQSTLHSTRFEAPSPRGSRILHRGAMEAALLNHPEFREHYLFVRNAPYALYDRALFVRRSFWEAHPRRAELQVVPVTETAIYPRGGGAASGGAPRASL